MPTNDSASFSLSLALNPGMLPRTVSAVHYGIEDTFVSNVVLPLCVRQIPRVTKLTFRRL